MSDADYDIGRWRETQDGWAVTLEDGLSANIQLKKSGLCRYNFMVSGACDSVMEARERIDEIARRAVGVDDAKAVKFVRRFLEVFPVGSRSRGLT